MKINSNCNSISYIAKLVRFPFPAFRFPFPICCFPFPYPPLYPSYSTGQRCVWKNLNNHFSTSNGNESGNSNKNQKKREQRKEKTKQMQKKTQSYEQHVCTREYLLEIQFSINAHKLISAQRERGRGGAKEWKGQRERGRETDADTYFNHTRICRSIKCKTFQFTFCFLASNIRESCQKYLSRVCRVCERESERARELSLSLSCFTFLHIFIRFLRHLWGTGELPLPQVNCLYLFLCSPFFIALSPSLSLFPSFTLLCTYARRRRVAGSLSAAEIPHHAEQTLVNYFYYIHGYSCTVTQFDP